MSDRPKSRVWAEVAKVVPGPCAGPGSTVVLTYVRTNLVGTLFARSLLVGIPLFLPLPPSATLLGEEGQTPPKMDALLCVLHLSIEHLFDRRDDEIRLLKLDLVAAAGGNDVDAVRGEAG